MMAVPSKVPDLCSPFEIPQLKKPPEVVLMTFGRVPCYFDTFGAAEIGIGDAGVGLRGFDNDSADDRTTACHCQRQATADVDGPFAGAACCRTGQRAVVDVNGPTKAVFAVRPSRGEHRGAFEFVDRCAARGRGFTGDAAEAFTGGEDHVGPRLLRAGGNPVSRRA
jgi:hypothetical protein